MAFVEWKEAGEITESPAKTMKLSEAIRRGKPLVGTEAADYRVCAMGCAWAGIHGRRFSFAETDFGHIMNVEGGSGRRFSEKMGIALGYPPELCNQISTMHCGGMPALEIADWLEAQGF